MGGPSIPNPTQAATQGIQEQTANYPFEYLINALSQEGGTGTFTPPGTTTPQTYDFSGLGTADVQNEVSAQMAQTLLDIQQGLGPQYISQRLQDLQQSDPQGYAAYGQLFDMIQNEAAAQPPNGQLSNSTQDAVLSLLQNASNLTPMQQQQVQQAVRAQQVASGVYLGSGPAQQEADALVNAADTQQGQVEGAASQYLSSGVSPSDIQYRKIQQDLANQANFISGQTPTSEFASLSGAQSGAAPTPPTGYAAPTINEGQAAGQGISNAFSLYGIANQNANPYLSGLSTLMTGANAAGDIYNPWSLGTGTTTGATGAADYGAGVGTSGLDYMSGGGAYGGWI